MTKKSVKKEVWARHCNESLLAYHAKGDARLHRPCDLRTSLESAMRRILKQHDKRLPALHKAAVAVAKRRNRHIQAVLNKTLRRRFQAAFRYGANYSKMIRELTGCSVDFLRQHLEAQWKPGMTWENYGIYGWHIDHKRPCASFDLTNPTKRAECFHFSNLQPLWAEDNLSKHDRLS
jgi:hypothetical protein